LITNVQTEVLTIDMYISTLKERIGRDKAIAMYFSKKIPAADEDPNTHRSTALLVMKRVQIMQKEVDGAEA